MSIPYYVTFPQPLTDYDRDRIMRVLRDADRRGRPVVMDSGGAIVELGNRSRVSPSFLRRARSRVR